MGLSVDQILVGDSLSGSRGEDQKIIAEVGLAIVAELLRKNADYGGSAWEDPCLLPVANAFAGMQVRMSDKIARLKTLLSGEKAQVSESVVDTFRDLAGYAILWVGLAVQRGLVELPEDSPRVV